MPTRRTALGALAGATIAMPALAQGRRQVKIATSANTTSNASFLMPKYLKDGGIDAEIVLFSSLLQRMQAVASGDVSIGAGGLSAVMQVSTRGVPMTVLCNGCDGGWKLVANPRYATLQDLKGKKIACQAGSIALAGLMWKLKAEGLAGSVEVVLMDGDKQPVPLYRGDVDAICGFEPFPTFAELNGWGKTIWTPYDTPMGKTNLGLVSSLAFVRKEPALTRALVQAHIAATNEIIANPAIALETTMKQFNLSRPIAEASNENLFFTVESGPGFQAGLKETAKMMIESKLLEKEPDWPTFIDTSFI